MLSPPFLSSFFFNSPFYTYYSTFSYLLHLRYDTTRYPPSSLTSFASATYTSHPLTAFPLFTKLPSNHTDSLPTIISFGASTNPYTSSTQSNFTSNHPSTQPLSVSKYLHFHKIPTDHNLLWHFIVSHSSSTQFNFTSLHSFTRPSHSPISMPSQDLCCITSSYTRSLLPPPSTIDFGVQLQTSLWYYATLLHHCSIIGTMYPLYYVMLCCFYYHDHVPVILSLGLCTRHSIVGTMYLSFYPWDYVPVIPSLDYVPTPYSCRTMCPLLLYH